MAKHKFVATLVGGKQIRRSYGVGYSQDEAWAEFCCLVWDKARAAKSPTVEMGEDTAVYPMNRAVPDPPKGMDSWTMLGAPSVQKP